MVQGNYAVQNAGRVAWYNGAAQDIDIRRHIGWSYSFEATADINVDAAFNIEAAMPSDADPCVPGPYALVEEIIFCEYWPRLTYQPAATQQIVIPAGTRTGTICSASLPCRPGAFVRLAAASGDTAALRGVAILHGPV